jgi:hypothetical protein
VKHRQEPPKPIDEPWTMDELQSEFERIVREVQDAGKTLTAKLMVSVADQTTKSAGRAFYRTLIETAPDMLADRRKELEGFERRNLRRWRKAFDLIETIFVSCEELGREFNQHHRPTAIAEQDYVFEAMTYLHAKALLVTAEIICLLKGGFADGALTRWRTLYETNVVAFLLRQEGQDLALRYLAHSRVQAWNEAQDEKGNTEERQRLEVQAEYAIEKFGPELKRRNGWACAITGQKHPTFEKLAELAGKADGKSLYRHASLHVHSNHRALDELLGMCETQEDVLLVGPSNSGMVGPLTLTAMSIVESTMLLLLTKPNLDRLAFVNALLRMANRMNKLASGIERRTFEAAQRRKAVVRDKLTAK